MWGKLCLWTLLVFVIMEHVAKKSTHDYARPSVVILMMANCCKQWWYKLGEVFGMVSSWLARIDFADIMTSIKDVTYSLWQLVSSPWELIKGYIHVMYTYSEPYLIFVGSILIVIFVLWLCYRCGVFEKIGRTRFGKWWNEIFSDCTNDKSHHQMVDEFVRNQ